MHWVWDTLYHYCRWNLPSKSFPQTESCVYLGPGIDHPGDPLRVLTQANKVVVAARDATRETPPVVEMRRRKYICRS